MKTKRIYYLLALLALSLAMLLFYNVFVYQDTEEKKRVEALAESLLSELKAVETADDERIVFGKINAAARNNSGFDYALEFYDKNSSGVKYTHNNFWDVVSKVEIWVNKKTCMHSVIDKDNLRALMAE